MKIIEERANDYAKGQPNELVAKKAYITAATEQQEIDIERFCSIYEKELRRLKRILHEMSGVPVNVISVGKSLSEIRKEILGY